MLGKNIDSDIDSDIDLPLYTNNRASGIEEESYASEENKSESDEDQLVSKYQEPFRNYNPKIYALKLKKTIELLRYMYSLYIDDQSLNNPSASDYKKLGLMYLYLEPSHVNAYIDGVQLKKSHWIRQAIKEMSRFHESEEMMRRLCAKYGVILNSYVWYLKGLDLNTLMSYYNDDIIGMETIMHYFICGDDILSEFNSEDNVELGKKFFAKLIADKFPFPLLFEEKYILKFEAPELQQKINDMFKEYQKDLYFKSSLKAVKILSAIVTVGSFAICCIMGNGTAGSLLRSAAAYVIVNTLNSLRVNFIANGISKKFVSELPKVVGDIAAPVFTCMSPTQWVYNHLPSICRREALTTTRNNQIEMI